MNRQISRRMFLNGLASTTVLPAYLGGHAMAAPTRDETLLAAVPDWQAGASPEWAEVMRAARAEGQVTVAAFPALAKKMSAAFQRDTGIKLNFFGGRSSEQSTRFESEARAKNLTIDIMLGGGRELGPMKQGGFLNPVKPQLMLPGVSPKNFRDGKLKFMDNEGQYLMQGAEWVFGWVLVNKNVIDPSEIKSWKDLLKPKYRGKIISHDPRSPGPGQGASNWIYNMFGIEFIKDFFLGQQVKFTSSNRQVVEEVVRGTKPIAFASIQFFVERFRREGITNLAVVLPEDAPGYLTGGFSVLKQAKGVPHPNAAKVFINWYMSHPGQEVYQSIMMETSRRLNVETNLPKYLVPRSGANYFEAYNEERYFRRRAVVKLITEALGNR